MVLNEPLFRNDVTTIKRYGNRYKLTYQGRVMTSGLDTPPPWRRPPQDDTDDVPPGRSACHLSRARSTVFELSMCNPWEYFCTFTLADDRGFDRCDLGLWHRNFSQWLRNLRRNHGGRMAYLIVPENHKDGAWHMHALMMGIPAKLLRQFTLTETLPYRLLKKVKAGDVIYDWPGYRAKYGWVTVEPIRDHDRCASYITKYVTKSLGEGSLMTCEHLFFSCHGLQRAEVVDRGYLHYPSDFQWDYENSYVHIKWADENVWGCLDPLERRCARGLGSMVVNQVEAAYAWDERDGRAIGGAAVGHEPGDMAVVCDNLFLTDLIFKPRKGGMLDDFEQLLIW